MNSLLRSYTLELIHSYLYDWIQRVKITSSFSYWSNAKLGIPQRSIKGPLLFNIFIYDLFFDFIEIYIANYADDTTPYALDWKLESIVKLLEENADNLFDWFSYNYLKPNPDKCHLFVNTTGDIRITAKKETISNSSNQKLLDIRFNNNFCFDDHPSWHEMSFRYLKQIFIERDILKTSQKHLKKMSFLRRL